MVQVKQTTDLDAEQYHTLCARSTSTIDIQGGLGPKTSGRSRIFGSEPCVVVCAKVDV
jgi:hypothetical protein